MKCWLIITSFLCCLAGNAQDTLQPSDTVSYELTAYIDSYYGLHSSPLNSAPAPYFVSHNSVNQVGIIVAFLAFSFEHRLVRGKFTPGFGTYFNENYAQEKSTHRFIMEANAGFALWPKKGIWLDIGVLPSPYTNETAISKDHLCYSRALAGEYVPYYMTGARLTVPLNEKFTAYAAYYNGWQQIADKNNKPAVGAQLEFKPSSKHLISMEAYAGDERFANDPTYRMRYLIDAYWLYNLNGKWSASASAYWGGQETTIRKASENYWIQANVAVRRTFTKNWSLSARAEYFSDPNLAMLPYQNFQGTLSTDLGSATFSLAKKFGNFGLLRLEGRYFVAEQNVFNAGTRSDAFWGIISFTAWINKKGLL